MKEIDFNSLIKHIDDEVTVLRIHMEELQDSLEGLKVLVASLLKNKKDL